ncbi:transcriptional regulator [Sphingobacterium faecium NBRC 15299]|uniref:LysR family transcriptional regulator n=1 Tax=Sphingobacterium faecium TaxID=34087 RepID=UPI000D3607D1|nr:LysR family transcriptional regulator [Sphingobacterium faecium]PTX13973.1 DNA-binding transcriptional LysR family regulator [Sphingobacterium faecium]GEM64055.1 transcriptional regulator [Sphingobacterium faecium NBRC 15299]
MSYQIELRHLYYFKVLAEELHFRKAAERLYISQPGLSRQIKQMEEIYQALLFDRGKRYVRLTGAGVYLKKEVDILFNQMDKMTRELRIMGSDDITELRLGFIGSAVQSVLAKVLVHLRHDFPSVEVDLQELSNEMQITKVLKEELDFGFVRLDDFPKGIHHIAIVKEHFSLVVPRDYPIQQANFTSVSEFKNEPFILFSKDYSHSYYDLVMSIFKDATFDPHVALRTVNALTIFNLVEQGLGVAIVPASLKNGYTSKVKFIDLIHIEQRTTLSLIYNASVSHPGIDLFLNVIQKELSLSQ